MLKEKEDMVDLNPEKAKGWSLQKFLEAGQLFILRIRSQGSLSVVVAARF